MLAVQRSDPPSASPASAPDPGAVLAFQRFVRGRVRVMHSSRYETVRSVFGSRLLPPLTPPSRRCSGDGYLPPSLQQVRRWRLHAEDMTVQIAARLATVGLRQIPVNPREAVLPT